VNSRAKKRIFLHILKISHLYSSIAEESGKKPTVSYLPPNGPNFNACNTFLSLFLNSEKGMFITFPLPLPCSCYFPLLFSNFYLYVQHVAIEPPIDVFLS
jgi:hypothetical protein